MKIEKGIAIPTAGFGSKYPFKDMLVGDSFAYPVASKGVFASAMNYRKANAGVKFLTRKVSATERRIWRVA